MILVDGDVIRYRCGFASEKTRYIVNREVINRDGEPQSISVNQFDNAKEANAWMKMALEHNPDDKLVRHSHQEIEPVEHALHSVKTLMASIQAEWPDENMVVFFSCPTSENWRTKFFPQYKANRKPRRPAHDQAISDYMEGKYHCDTREGYEADDLIGIYAAEHPGSIVATNDKDMDQIAGQHYDFTKRNKYFVTPAEAHYVKELQTVMGDTTDNIPGIAGLGAVYAAQALEKFTTALDVYEDHYDTGQAAHYWFLVNRAMVSLPTCYEDVEIWTEDIEDAREAFQALQQGGEDDLPNTGSTGDSGECPPPAEASCA